MRKLAFPPELRTASIVPRWSIVWTLNKDYVSNHSFFVTMYAVSIARLIEWKGRLDFLMYEALTHDLDETVTGDIVSPVKREIVDKARADDYVTQQLDCRMPFIFDIYEDLCGDHGEQLDDVTKIVKAADRLDALLFLVVERRLGNTVIGPRIPDAQTGLEAAWRNLPGRQDLINATWQLEVLPAIEAHGAEGGFGV